MFNIYYYNKDFSKLFLKEKNIIEKILKNLWGLYYIEHIGSTAIKNMIGKGIIDIMIACKHEKDILAVTKLLKNNGYYIAERKSKNKRILLTSSKVESSFGDIHLHITALDDQDFINAVLFRHCLNKNKLLAKEYSDLKRKLFDISKWDRQQYTKMKAPFIEKVLGSIK